MSIRTKLQQTWKKDCNFLLFYRNLGFYIYVLFRILRCSDAHDAATANSKQGYVEAAKQIQFADHGEELQHKLVERKREKKMEALVLEKIGGLFSNNISRDDLKPGDHIYSWRNAHIYSHHGIYIGDGKVIHFTRGGGLETGAGTFLDNLIVSSVPNHNGIDNPCPNCGQRSNLHGVISSCLDCFLSGGNLNLFQYNVSPAIFMARLRAIYCAKCLLERNGFGDYHAFENNCEDVAIYCKTSFGGWQKLCVGKKRSSQCFCIVELWNSVLWCVMQVKQSLR